MGALTPPEILAPLHETLAAAAPRVQEAADLYAEAAAIDPNDTEARKEKVDEANQKYAEVLQEIQGTLMVMSQQEAGDEAGGEAGGETDGAGTGRRERRGESPDHHPQRRRHGRRGHDRLIRKNKSKSGRDVRPGRFFTFQAFL